MGIEEAGGLTQGLIGIPLRLKAFFPKAVFFLLQGQSPPVGQEADGFRVRKVFDLLDELDHIAPLMATKTIKDLLAG